MAITFGLLSGGCALVLKYIEPYVAQCKELEKMCVDGVATIKAKVSELEEIERNNKIDTLKKLFEFKEIFWSSSIN